LIPLSRVTPSLRFFCPERGVLVTLMITVAEAAKAL
jgi:hypothetical protein